MILGDKVKKIVLMCVSSLLLFTGCTSKITCTVSTKNGEDASGAEKMDTILNVTFDKDKVKKVNQKMTLTFKKDDDIIDTVFDAINDGYKEFKKEKGIKIDTSKDKNKIVVDVEIIPEKQKDSTNNIINVDLSKEELISDLESEGYTCK